MCTNQFHIAIQYLNSQIQKISFGGWGSEGNFKLKRGRSKAYFWKFEFSRVVETPMQPLDLHMTLYKTMEYCVQLYYYMYTWIVMIFLTCGSCNGMMYFFSWHNFYWYRCCTTTVLQCTSWYGNLYCYDISCQSNVKEHK